MIIDEIKIKIIQDSRGKDTLEAEMWDEGRRVDDEVPSGKSTGAHEAVALEPKIELERFGEIKDKILAKDFGNQKEFDNFLIDLDGTENKSNLGANLILALSLAFARLKAKEENLELYEYIRNNKQQTTNNKQQAILRPVFNVINGGAHAKNTLEFQEFQVIPYSAEQCGTDVEGHENMDFGLAMSVGREFYRKLREKIESRFGKENVFLGDEAGYSAPFASNEEAIEMIAELVEEKKYPLRIGLDVAASQFYQQPTTNNQQQGSYLVGGKEYSAEELLEKYLKLIEAYNILSIEDPFDEEDFASFAKLTNDQRLTTNNRKGRLIITDDLTTTNPKRLQEAIDKKAGNAILVKLNQIGTLTETLDVVRMAYGNNWKAIISHRSGETTDDFIADLAVGVGAWGLKSGAPAKPERMAKYDRVLKIFEKISKI